MHDTIIIIRNVQRIDNVSAVFNEMITVARNDVIP